MYKKGKIRIMFTFLMCFAFLIYLLPMQVLAFGPSSKTQYSGIDVSRISRKY